MSQLGTSVADATLEITTPSQKVDPPSARQNAASPDNELPLYSSDDFRMWCMKVIPCTKRFVHDWSVCPFAHAGEKAVRRDPRTHEYTGIACPDMKKTGSCLRGENCPYAHNVFEYWLHPTRYRTQLCNDGPACKRSICFFAHSLDELRTPAVKPYVSPETLARASLEAIHQNPHPLGQQLAHPLRLGGPRPGRGRMPRGEAASAPFPDGGRFPPWQGCGGPARGEHRGAAAQPPGSWRGSFPAPQLRSSADYSRHPQQDFGGGPYAAGPVGGGVGGAGGAGMAGAPGGLYAVLGATAGLSLTPECPLLGMPLHGGEAPAYMRAPTAGLLGRPFPSSAAGGGGAWPTAFVASSGYPAAPGAFDAPGSVQDLGAASASLQALLAGRLSSLSNNSAPETPLPACLSDPSGSLQALLSGRLSAESVDASFLGPGRLSDSSSMAQAASLQAALTGRLSDPSMAQAAPLQGSLVGQLPHACPPQAASQQAGGGAPEGASGGQQASSSMEGALEAPVGTQQAQQVMCSRGRVSVDAGDAGARLSGSSSTTSLAEGGSGVSSPHELPLGITMQDAGSASVDAVPAAPAEASQATQAEGLAQSLASMKIARTQQQVAASAGSNHEIVISTLHQILRDAVAQKSAGGSEP